MKTGTCKFGLNCRFNHPPKRRHRAKPEKQSEYVQTIKAAHKGSGSEKMGQTTCKNAEKKQKGTVLKKVEQTEKKVGEKEKKVAQKNFKPEDAEKKQKGTVLKKVEQTEKKAVEKEERTPSKKMDQEKVTLKKQWKVVQKAAREEHEESSLIMEVQTSCRVDEKEKEIAHSFMQLKCEKTEEKQKAILLRTVEQTEIKAAEDKQSFPERIEHEDKKVDILSLPEEKQTLSGRSEQQDYKAAREKGKETTSEKGEQTEFKAGTEEGKETTLGKGGLIEHKAAVEKSKETTLEKGGQIECKFYTMPGGCKYGKSCKYVHSQKKMEGNSSKLNFLGLPIRLGAKECPYYMRTGNCKFSTNCRYHHPDPTVAMVGHDPHSGCQSSGSMQQSAFGASTMPVTPSRSQGTLNGPTSFVVASPACSPASNLLSQGFHSNSECNGYQSLRPKTLSQSGTEGGKMTSAAGGTPPQNPTPPVGEAERRRSPIRKKTATRTRDASGKEDVVMEEEKEGAFLLGEPTFLDLGGGRLRCVETGHELLAKDEEAYGRTKACRLALIDAAVAQKKPPLNMFQPHPTSKSQLVCKLTGDSVNKSEEHIWKHINGRKFHNKLEQKEMEKHSSAEAVEKDTKQSKKQVKSTLGSRNRVRKKDINMNDSHTKKTKADDDDDMVEPEFWVPPVGSRWDLDDGKDRWDPQTNMVDEADDGSGLDGISEKDDPETIELSNRTKRMSIVVGPSSFASRKKKIKKAATLPNGS
ncbi:uncharacterized protein LOC135631850 isoform X5 [Musa acuminata AAA Group]|uniref:uncharacterized protein LOC135631850 isoform X5 n=1 Tax=Musa acuminata AAA Group TaxID=214697 RepID=UPI0031E2F94F